MKKRFIAFLHTLFSNALDLRIRIFNVLAAAGCVGAVVITGFNALSGVNFQVVLANTLSVLLSAGLICYAYRTHRYRDCYLVTIIVIFFGLFPYFFLRLGGYYGGMPMFFIFAAVFTVFMLEGRLALLITAAELVVYSGLIIYAYKNPNQIARFPTERGFMTSNLLDLLVVAISLGTTMYAQVSLYRAQQRRADAQNAVLEQINRSKTQFLANTSHEMRTPLTVISVDVQTVMGLLKRMDGLAEDTEMQELLQDAQAEIMRLSRMVGGMLALNSIAENTEKGRADLSALLINTADMLRLLLSRQNNQLTLDVADGLEVYGNVDLLSQVLVNLLQNANTHTAGGEIRLRAAARAGEITVAVSDNGSGISPALLPHVFERGVSEGGTGMGLFICKTIVESHGGKITIDSEAGNGTTVTFTLPVYQGQFGGDEV